MSAKDNGGPAFPCLPPLGPDGTSAVGYPYVTSGLSIRDYFAAKAMQALIMTPMNDWPLPEDTESVSEKAYLLADAMLKERAK